MKQIYVSQFNDHMAEQLEEEFYLKNIVLNYTQATGTPYLYLTLQDKSGSIKGRIWEKNIEDRYLNLKGAVVKVNGEVLKNHDGQLEFIGWKMVPATEYKMENFVNGLTKDETQKYLLSMEKQSKLIMHAAFSELVQSVLTGHRNKLSEAPASLSQVGCYNGGLLVQTVSVTSIAIQIMRSQQIYAYHPSLKLPYQEDLLIAGALLFGIGVTNLYSPFPNAEKISEFALLQKDMLSIQIIESYMSKMNCFLCMEDKNLLYHVIQSAYKFDAKPMNREALILNMSYGAYLRISSQEYYLAESQQKNGAIFIPQLKNYLYFPANTAKGGIKDGTP